MKIKILKCLTEIVAAYAVLPLLADITAAGNPAQDFPQAVRFELGVSDFASGDSITINEVRGTADAIRPGENYCVAGTYTLKSQGAADLSFFETVSNGGSTPVDPQQTVQVVKGTGSFRLIKHVTDDGYLHVSFYSRATGQGFGGVYFGQGEWVLRHKFSQKRDFVARTSQEPVVTSGPNQALFDYLGNPVAPPENLDVSYTKDGLSQAMETAAKNIGISLVKLQIDDSEFPFLVGVVCANKSDMEKLKDQVRTMTGYKCSGGVGGDDSYAMNVVPSSVFPADARQQIYRRMMLREELLSDKINGVQ